MARELIHYKRRPLRLHPTLEPPDITAPTVLGGDPWDYVSLWLRREGYDEARFFWNQAREFYRASMNLPATASPLTSYYSLMNAAKALLSSRGTVASAQHGVDGWRIKKKGKPALKHEKVRFATGGVAPVFASVLGPSISSPIEHTLDELFHVLPFLHRAYLLTYRSAAELFLPLAAHGFMRDPASREAWLYGEISKRYVTAHLEDALPSGFELDEHFPDKHRREAGSIVVRRKKRFVWDGKQRAAGLSAFGKYHRDCRRYVQPIHAPETRWYLRKRDADPLPNIDQLTVILGAMHRLSELSRYDPLRLREHLGAGHNWLVSEFLALGPPQFLHGVAAEITGVAFRTPDAFRLRGDGSV